MPVKVEIQNVTKKFGDFKALDDVSVVIEPGELFFLLGPSGCGKTTLLRCIAGFHAPEKGRIFIGDRDVTAVPPHRRNTGMVFQSYALWPHMTVEENVAFGLEMRRFSREETKRKVMRALEVVHLADRASVKPNELSGGQQQRVALARALVIEPQCLLLDEPLSNLDAKLRLEMRIEIRRICKEAGLTAIYVTHDQKEALSIADRMALMRQGVVEQTGAPEQLYRHPASRFAAAFIGEGNFCEGRITGQREGGFVIECGIGELLSTSVCAGLTPGESVSVCIRPESICFDATGGEHPNRMSGIFKECVYLGEIAQHLIQLDAPDGNGQEIRAFEINPRKGASRVGSRVKIRIDPENVIVTSPAATGA